MNEEMVKRWNAVVTPGDTVYYLGDFSLARRSVELFVPRLNGGKYFIMGNHDVCHPCHKKKAEGALQIYQDVGFKIIGLETVIEIGGEKVLLHHMPYQSSGNSDGYSQEPKHLKYRPKDEGMWFLHGHEHEKWKTKGRMINIGVDVWDFCPVPISEIENIMRLKPPGSDGDQT
jgi:calcineurin-like phosphoesterase family protein